MPRIRGDYLKSNMTYKTNILNAVFIVIAYLIIGMLIPTALNMALWRPFLGNLSNWINIATLILISIIFFIGLAKFTGYRPAIIGNITLSGLLLAIGCSILFFLLMDNFLDPIFDSMFPASANKYQEALTDLRQSPTTAFIRICLFAPITEELLIRGYLLTGLQNKYRKITALIVTTFLFAILHFNFVQTLSAVICGLVLGLLYIKTESLFCCILAHAMYNSISYFTEIIIPR